MNEITVLINYIIEKFNTNSLVNTITMMSDAELDSQKENLYMLVNIAFLESEPKPDVIVCYFKMKVLQQRNTEAKQTDSKLQFDTNLIDNLNETHSVANKFIKHFEIQSNVHNIELESVSRLRVLKDAHLNSLDGYEFNISLSIPNKTSAC